MPYLDSNVRSNIYYAFIDPTILSFFRPISDISDFFTLSNQHLKKMQKQGIKYRSIISMLKKIFGKYLNFFKVFTDPAENFIKLSSLR